MPDRLRVSLKRQSAMTVNRISLDHEKLVYVICANKRWTYPDGRSPIVYIGTTKRGVARMAVSAAGRTRNILWEHGVTSMDARVVRCQSRRGVASWRKLERALLLAFREQFGGVPYCNFQGSGIKEANEFALFSRSRINKIIDDLTDHGSASERAPIVDTIDVDDAQIADFV